ncbi:SRPBCC family protein [Parapedobacter tibetensis]|uniref:SRPBCC family protein n=1 Tax=Parapedobacter tibetensis TaxID=2972951 RepID=UPI00214D2490|nr:SRPBCC family protein [Parapedobacter tibetensis]
METKQLVFEHTYSAPIERVWKALTDKEQLKAWYFDIADFKPELGFEFTFSGGKDGENFVHHCKVVEVNPPHKLSYTWAYEGYPGQSLVSFELDELSAKETKLTLTHSDIDTFPDDNDAFAPASFNEGWTFILGESLRKFVETESFAQSTVISASLEKVWHVIMHPNGQWGNAFGGGALLKDTDWQVGSPVIWTDLEGDIGANGIVTANNGRDLLDLTYYDELHPAPDAQLGDYIERFRLTQNEDGHTALTIDIEELPKMYISMHKEMWENALQIIKKEAEA